MNAQQLYESLNYAVCQKAHLSLPNILPQDKNGGTDMQATHSSDLDFETLNSMNISHDK